MKYILILFFNLIISYNSISQLSSEDKEFLKDLYWGLPFKYSYTQCFKFLNNSEVFTNVINTGAIDFLNPGRGIDCYAKSNPYFKSTSFFLDTSIKLYVFFNSNGESERKRIVLRDQVDKKNFQSIANLLKSLNCKYEYFETWDPEDPENNRKKDILVEFSVSATEEPFFIITLKQPFSGKSHVTFDIWLELFDERL